MIKKLTILLIAVNIILFSTFQLKAQEDLLTHLQEARDYYGQGKTDEAIKTLEDILKTDKNFIQAYFMLGNIYILENNPGKAKEIFTELDEINPDDKRVIYLLAACDYLSYDYSLCQKNLKKLLDIDPTDILSRNYLALALSRGGDNNKALEEIITSIKYNLDGSGDFTLYSELEILFSNTEKITPSLEDIEEIARSSQENASSFIALGWFSYNEEDLEEAGKLFQKAIELDPEDAMAHYLSGLVHYRLNSCTSAIEEYEKALSIDKDFVDSIRDTLQYIEEAKRNNQILEWEEKLTKEPENHNIMFELAKYYYARESYSQAEELMLKAIELSREEGKYYNILGEIYIKRYKLEDAIEAFSLAVKYEDGNGIYWSNLCYAYEKKGLFKDAVKAGQKALELEPGNEVACKSTAISLYYLEEYDRSIEMFKKAVIKSPEDGELICRYAMVLQARGYLEEASKNYRLSIEKSPDLLDSYYNLANTLLTLGRYEEALDYFLKVMEMRKNYRSIYTPDFNAAQINMARTLLKLNKSEEAIKLLNLVILENPLDPSAHLYLAYAYEKQNKTEEADREFTKVYYLITVTDNENSTDEFMPYSDSITFKAKSRPVTSYSITIPERWTPLNMGEARFVLEEPEKSEEELLNYGSPRELIEFYLYEKNTLKALDVIKNLYPGDLSDFEEYNLKGIIYTMEGKTELALIEFNKALELNPNSYEVHNNIGVFYQSIKNYTLAIEHLKKSLKLSFFNTWAYNNLGIIYLDQENYLSAEEAFFFAKVSDLKSSWARHNLGWTHYKLDNMKDAIKELEESIKLNPEESIFYSHLGWIYLEIDNKEEALNCFKKAQKLAPEEANTYNTIGVILLENGIYNEGVENFKKAMDLLPEEERYIRNLGIAYYKMGNYKEAQEAFEEAVKLNPYAPENHLNLSSSLCKQYKFDEGSQYLENALNYNERDYSPVNEIIITNNQGALYLDQGKLELAEKQLQTIINYRETYKGLEKYLFSYYIDTYNNMGLLKYRQGLKEEAVAMLEEAIGLQDNNPDILNNLAFILEEENADEARELYEKAIELNPQKEDYYNNLAVLYFKNVDINKAEEVIERGLEKKKNSDLLKYNLAGIYFSSNLFSEATILLKNISQSSVIAPEANYLLGLIYYKEGKTLLAEERFKKAISQKKLVLNLLDAGWTYMGFQAYRLAFEKFQGAIEAAPDNGDGYIGIGTYYFNTSHMEKAEEFINKSIKLQPGEERAYIIRSLIYYRKEDYEKSIKDLKTAIDLNQKNSLAYYNYGYMQQEHGDIKNALKAYEEVISIANKSLLAVCAEGFIFYYNDRYREAKANAYQVIQNDPTFADAYYILGKIAEKEGDIKKALFEYERAVNADPQHIEAAQGVKRLKNKI